MIIQHNIPAVNAHRNLGINNANINKNLEKLSSGYRINRAADDAAGLAISEKMRGQIRGLGMAVQNANHAINLIQTAEGALNETHAMLQRMRELAVQSANGTYQNEVDREALDLEYQALKSEIDRIAQSTEYNTMKLFEHIDYVRYEVPQNQVQDTNYPWGDMLINNMYQQGSFSMKQFSAEARFSIDIQVSPTGEVESLKVVDQIGDFYSVTVSDTGTGYHRFTVRENIPGGAYNEILIKSADYIDNFAGGVLIFACRVSQGGNGGDTYYQPDRAFMWKLDDVTPEFTFQIGANGTADQEVTLFSRGVSSKALGIDGTDILNRQNAKDAIGLLDTAVNQISSFRAYLGSLQNRLEHTINNLGVTRENLQAAESTIRDADMAKEMMEFTKNSILVQASQAMLAQANVRPQGVLSLLG